MPRRGTALALLIAGVSATAAESSPPPTVQRAKEAVPATKQKASAERTPGERKSGEPPQSSRDTSKPPPPVLEDKNLGLGCAKD